MAYLSPHFEQEVFVSYSHGDPRSGTLKDWTLELVRKLERHMWDTGPEFEDFVLWRDEDLDPTSKLTDELKAKVKSSAILFIVMSPHYHKSAWCKDELTWFREQIEERRAQDPGRVFIIRARLTEEREWPGFLRDERGYAPIGFHFHDRQSDTPYCWDGSKADYDEYLKCLGTLRRTLIKHLRDLRIRKQAQAESQAAAPQTHGGTRRIYLHARAEDAPIRQEVHDRLLDDGFEPAGGTPDPGKELIDWMLESKIRIKTAKDCDALALIRAKGDANFPFTLRNIGYYERETIDRARRAPLPCAVLDHSGEELPIDVSGWGIERFDLLNGDWRGEFSNG